MKELEILLNKHSIENYSNTPDYILAKFLHECLIAFNGAMHDRDRWHGVQTLAERRNHET